MPATETITIARHAWAGHFGDPGWPDDSLRELQPDGSERYARVVAALAERGFAPTLIATSPYLRCVQTAEIIAQHTPHGPDIVQLDALRPGSDFEAICDWTRHSKARDVCWVGHAPDVGAFTAALIGMSDGLIRFSKGAVASVRVHKKINANCGELYWLVTAKLLGL